MPSTPRFNMPERSVNISPIVAYRTAIEEDMVTFAINMMASSMDSSILQDINLR